MLNFVKLFHIHWHNHVIIDILFPQDKYSGNSLAVQWLGLSDFTARVKVWFLVEELDTTKRLVFFPQIVCLLSASSTQTIQGCVKGFSTFWNQICFQTQADTNKERGSPYYTCVKCVQKFYLKSCFFWLLSCLCSLDTLTEVQRLQPDEFHRNSVPVFTASS